MQQFDPITGFIVVRKRRNIDRAIELILRKKNKRAADFVFGPSKEHKRKKEKLTTQQMLNILAEFEERRDRGTEKLEVDGEKIHFKTLYGKEVTVKPLRFCEIKFK